MNAEIGEWWRLEDLVGLEPVLSGTRVVDLTHLWSGPQCTKILVDLGAEVIKVEASRRPDGLRLLTRDERRDPSFDALTTGKRCLALDLRREAARQILADLIATSHVVVDNWSPRVVRNWGLGWDVVSQWPQTLLWVAMPAYASSGPYRDYTAHGPALEGISGFAHMYGNDDRPKLYPFPIVDPTAGLHGAVAVVAGLDEVRQSGRSLRIEVPQSEVALQLAAALTAFASIEDGTPPAAPDAVTPRAAIPAPPVGAHTNAVLRDLGYPDPSIEHLNDIQAVAQAEAPNG